MPDLTYEIHQQCKPPMVMTSRNGKYTITGIGRERQFPHCTCPAYKFGKGKECKHIREAEEDMCGWHSMFSDEVQTDYQRENQICPRCGGDTELVYVGV